MHKMHQNAPLAKLMRSLKPPSRNVGLLLRGMEGRTEGAEREGNGIPHPQSQCE